MNLRWAILIVAVALGLVTSPREGRAANCSAVERLAADKVLLGLAADQEAGGVLSDALLIRHLPHGVHISRHAAQDGADNERILIQTGYVMSHDADLRTALWVAYELTSNDIAGAVGKSRTNCFRRDPRLLPENAASTADYDEPIFDQGHMANDADMKDDLTEQLNTYVMSNMSPQYCRFNRGIWLSLEHLGRQWASAYGYLHITSGAVFDFNSRDARDRDRSAARMGSRSQIARIAIPSDYYKVFMRRVGDRWHSIAFLLENSNEANGTTWSEVRPKVEARIVSLADIEAISEVTLHPNIDRRDLVESTDGAFWDLSLGLSNFEGSCK